MTIWKDHIAQMKSNPRKADVESLYAIIDRLLLRIEELESQLQEG